MRAAVKTGVRVAIGVLGATFVIVGLSLWRAYTVARRELPESRCDGHATFVHSQWMDTTLTTSRLAVRGCMVDDLLARHELRGMTRAQVIGLIGEPQASDLFPGSDMVYWLGPERGLIGTDSEFLVIRLDQAGRVTTVEILTS